MAISCNNRNLAQGNKADSLVFETIYSYDLDLNYPQITHIKDEESLFELYAEINKANSYPRSLPIPSIDFSKESLIVIQENFKVSDNEVNDILITSVEKTGDEIDLKYDLINNFENDGKSEVNPLFILKINNAEPVNKLKITMNN